MRIITWNMQGATSGGESKWNTDVTRLFKGAKADVVCLQEAGCSFPASGEVIPAPAWISVAPKNTIIYFRWNIGSHHQPMNIYVLWIQCDLGANRNNLAIASTIPPVNLIYTLPGLPGGRPGLGMRLSYNNAFINVFTLHAFSGNGNDAPGLLRSINEKGSPWFAAGDYNRDPSIWDISKLPTNTALCEHNLDITHPGSGTNLDYAFFNPARAFPGTVMNNFVVSDHYPVVYDV